MALRAYRVASRHTLRLVAPSIDTGLLCLQSKFKFTKDVTTFSHASRKSFHLLFTSVTNITTQDSQDSEIYKLQFTGKH